MHDHPFLPWSNVVKKDRGIAHNGYAVIRGSDPMANGSQGDILGLIKENPGSHLVEEIALTRVDGETIQPKTWYGMGWKKRSGL